MKKFTLTEDITILDNGNVYVFLKPSDALIEKYIGTGTEFDSTYVQLDIDNFKTEMIEKLFNDFKGLEQVPDSIKNQFEL